MPSDEHARRTSQPSTCENPEADCHREPDEYVEWAEDYTSENEWNEHWLCEQCASMLERGTVISPNEMSRRRS